MTSVQEAHPLALGWFNTPEQRKPIKLEVEGSIPSWVKGSLYRGAPGVYDIGTYTSEHWFDGFSRLNRFEISNGEVSYKSRNATDEMLAFIEETGRYPGSTFSQDPCKMVFGALETTFRKDRLLGEHPSAKNVGVDWIKNWPGLGRTNSEGGPLKNLVATTDANELMSLDPDTLEPLEAFDYQKYHEAFDRAGMSAAHPTHGEDGSLYNHVLLPTTDGGAEYKVFELNPKGEVRVLASITDAPASYIHEVFGTKTFVILIVWQAHIDFEKMGQVGSVLGAIKPWDGESKTLFYVIDKKDGGVVAKYTTEPFFTFHAIAAYEDEADNSIVIDLPWMKNWDFLQAARLENLRANVGRLNGNASHDIPGTFRRYRLPNVRDGPQHVRKAIVDFELPHDSCNIELPKLNEAYRLKPYRYAYGVHVQDRGTFADSLVKIDVKERTSKIFKPSNLSVCSEPIFVASPDSRSEDDGVLLSIVMDSTKRKSAMIVVDAKEMKEIARAKMPMVMGYGFHGTYAAA